MPDQQIHNQHEATERTGQCTIQLSIEDQLALVKAILDPPEPNETLRKAVDVYNRLVRESRLPRFD